MLKVLEDIHPEYDKAELTTLGMIDICNDFDAVNHSLLLKKLNWFRPDGSNAC